MTTKRGMPILTKGDLKKLASCRAIERRIEVRAVRIAKADPSWRGPGDAGLAHWQAASEPTAKLGQAFYL